MKANELMIGDWVRVLGSRSKALTHQVSQIDSYSLYAAICCEEYEFEEADIEPIHLTEEILKANADPHIKYENICGYLSITIRKEGLKDKDAKGHFPIRIVVLDGKVIHVHELQHALRLCGLNELADNFKI